MVTHHQGKKPSQKGNKKVHRYGSFGTDLKTDKEQDHVLENVKQFESGLVHIGTISSFGFSITSKKVQVGQLPLPRPKNCQFLVTRKARVTRAR